MNPLVNIAIAVTTLSSSLQATDSFVHNINNRVVETIHHADTVPGLKSEEFNVLRPSILKCWEELLKAGVLEVTATDKDTRPIFVALQGIFEHILSNELNKSIQSLSGVIFTPMPATPLCTDGGITPNLVAPSVESDPLRAFTVTARTVILRKFLALGGDLYVVYPKEGMAKRTEDQQKVYKKELETYPTHLFDRPLEVDAIDNELIGALYLFKHEGKKFAFAIKMSQANSPQDMGSFGLWFGEADKGTVAERVTKVMEVIAKATSQSVVL
jgi:hypothetical protein